MPAMSLNHYTIQARDLEATKNFYTDIVGLTVGDRPPLTFPGYWLYCGGIPTVHLLGYQAQADRPTPPTPAAWITSRSPAKASPICAPTWNAAA
jgi:catechol 2,3-dioxygenase-like lactoylglutathione lyase family enzyme